jgi:hypothetical protein
LLETIDRYTFIGTPLRLDLVCQVANRILRRRRDRDREEERVGTMWARRFVDRHLEFKTIKLHFLDQSRKAIYRKDILTEWYKLFEFLIEENGLELRDI